MWRTEYMTIILIFAGIAMVWLGITHKRKSKAYAAFNAKTYASAWFKENEINQNTVVFSSYTEPGLTSGNDPHATILVGYGTKAGGEKTGFAIEVQDGRGVIYGDLISENTASFHKSIAIYARSHGETLTKLLIEQSRKQTAGIDKSEYVRAIEKEIVLIQEAANESNNFYAVHIPCPGCKRNYLPSKSRAYLFCAACKIRFPARQES
jgi:hypothetical protein